MAKKSDKWITRQEIIKQIGESAYREAIAEKRLAFYKFSKAPNSEHCVKVKEFEAFVESCRVE